MGRIHFAISLAVFGTQHFLYARFVATLVPAWIPGRFFWSVFVGVAFFAAALSIATKKSSGWSTTLLGPMFFLWVFVVHLPRVAAFPHDGKEWTRALVALAMWGRAWLMSSGAVLARKR
jgi:uncharacterized membrane protein